MPVKRWAEVYDAEGRAIWNDPGPSAPAPTPPPAPVDLGPDDVPPVDKRRQPLIKRQVGFG